MQKVEENVQSVRYEISCQYMTHILVLDQNNSAEFKSYYLLRVIERHKGRKRL